MSRAESEAPLKKYGRPGEKLRLRAEVDNLVSQYQIQELSINWLMSASAELSPEPATGHRCNLCRGWPNDRFPVNVGTGIVSAPAVPILPGSVPPGVNGTA